MRIGADDGQAGPHDRQRTGLARALYATARAGAVVGGFVLLGVAAITFASVLGRLFFGRPIYGNYELVELMTGIAVLSFFPYTHVERGNVAAEFFTQRAPAALKRLLETLADLAFLAIAAFLFWRVAVGFVEALGSQNRSFVLNLPEWVFYGPATVWLGLLVLVIAGLLVASARGPRG